MPVILAGAIGTLSGVGVFGAISVVVTQTQYMAKKGAILNAYAEGIGKPVGDLTLSDKTWAHDVFRHTYVSARLRFRYILFLCQEESKYLHFPLCIWLSDVFS